MGVRQQQKEQRRWLILRSALDLFVRRGYAETSVGDIAQAADMSTGLLFHYFDSKEALYLALVEMGAEGTKRPQEREAADADDYFAGFLQELFAYAESEPWVAQLFVLMGCARREGAPDAVRITALSVDQVATSAKVIEHGQRTGLFRKGDPLALSSAFWSSVQGVMETWASELDTGLPEADWLMSILRKEKRGVRND